jgi:hypothetical protein
LKSAIPGKDPNLIIVSEGDFSDESKSKITEANFPVNNFHKPRKTKKINADLSINMFKNRNRIKLFSQERKVPLRPFSISPSGKRPIMMPPFKDTQSKNFGGSK